MEMYTWLSSTTLVRMQAFKSLLRRKNNMEIILHVGIACHVICIVLPLLIHTGRGGPSYRNLRMQ